MAKKKSKSQKYKKNQKKKLQKEQLAKQSPKETKKEIQSSTGAKKGKQVVEKDKVVYNVLLKNLNKTPSGTKPIKKENSSNNKKVKTTKKSDKLPNKVKVPKTFPKKEEFNQKNKTEKKKITQQNKKVIKKSLPKPIIPIKNKNNLFFRLLYEIKNNTHIIFNTILIITFLITLIGLIRIEIFKTGTIVYVSCIALFLMLVAISYNKFLSGKVFTIILTIIMSFAIYKMQYTYDFIRNLNSNVYEYKTYYVVTFATTVNRSIYSINDKKVGLLEENCINIERKLNTKLDAVKYIEYDNINELFEGFYNQEFRAIIVNENQYKYLENNIAENSRSVKILYEFKVNAKK